MSNLLTLGRPAQDYIVLGGLPSPGRATPVGLGSPRVIDVQKPNLASGATCRFVGNDVCHFSVMIDVWDDLDFPIFYAWAKLCLAKTPPGVTAVALAIHHPQINNDPTNIHSVMIEDVLDLGQDETGMWTWEIKLVEFRLPQPIPPLPPLLMPDVEAPGPVKAEDVAESQMAALAEQADKRAAVLASFP